ncbi:hypothetical protein [Haloarcula sp. JP-L23]|uniref:hypothetical protein n=1 Tax=Haloarcula sp. JP-L23 TaxID=2716717 RepID=UPI00140F1E7E|nr:hypothetical protein G9465_17370 [Haloarcula sp. JP-L23]
MSDSDRRTDTSEQTDVPAKDPRARAHLSQSKGNHLAKVESLGEDEEGDRRVALASP